MPLAHQVGTVALGGQMGGQGGIAWFEPRRIAGYKGKVKADIGCIAAGHKGGAGRCAGGMDVVIREADRVGRQRVQVGSDKDRIRIAEAHIRRALVICQAKEK